MARTLNFSSSDRKPDTEKPDWETLRKNAEEGEMVTRAEIPGASPYAVEYDKEGKVTAIITEDRVAAEKEEAITARPEETQYVQEEEASGPQEPKVYYASSWGAPGEKQPEDAVSNEQVSETGVRSEPKIPGIENIKQAPPKEMPIAEKRTAPELKDSIPNLADHFAAVTGSTESTRKEKREASLSYLKSLVEKASGTLGSASENFSPKYEKGLAWLAARKETLGQDLKRFGIDFAKNTLEDTKSLGRGTFRAVRNPGESVRATAEMAKRIYTYKKSLFNADLSLTDMGKKLGTDLKTLGHAYRAMPQNRKILLSAALAGGSLGFGGGAALVASVFAAGKYGARALSGLSIYTALEAMGEEKISAQEIETQEIRSRVASWKKHGIAAAAGLAIASGVPGSALRELFSSGEDGVSYLYHAMNSAAPSSSPSAASSVEGQIGAHGHATLDELKKESTDSLLDHGPVDLQNTVSEVAPVEGAKHLTPITSLSVEVKKGFGYEQMVKELYRELHDPVKHFDTSKVIPGSDLEQILKADDTTINGLVHRLAESHGILRDSSGGAIVLEHSHMTFRPDGSLEITEGEHGPTYVNFPENPDAPELTPVSVPEVRPEQVFPPVQTVEAPLPVHEAALATPDTTRAMAPSDTLSSSASHDFSGRTGERVPYGKNAGAGAHIPLQNASPEMLVPNTEGIITNHFGLEVSATEPHIYASPDGKHLFAYGGDGTAQDSVITEYLKSHKGVVVYGTDKTGQYRVPYYQAPDGSIMPGPPIRTKGILGFFSDFMKAPSPDELKNLVQ